jgi:hypothetical protein
MEDREYPAEAQLPAPHHGVHEVRNEPVITVSSMLEFLCLAE